MCNGRICRECTRDGSPQVLLNEANRLIMIESGKVRPVVVGELTPEEAEALGKQFIRAASIARGYQREPEPERELTPVDQLIN